MHKKTITGKTTKCGNARNTQQTARHNKSKTKQNAHKQTNTTKQKITKQTKYTKIPKTQKYNQVFTTILLINSFGVRSFA